MSPVATRQRPCHSKTYSPVGPAARRRVAGRRVQRAPGRGVVGAVGRVDLVEPRVAEPLGDRRPDDDRIAGRDERPGRPARARTRRRPGRATRRRAGHEADVGGAHRVAPVRAAVACHDSSSSAAQVGPLGQAQRHVAQVDHEAAEAAGHLDREVAPARTEPDRVAEAELGDRGRSRAAGRRGRGRPGSGRAATSPDRRRGRRREPALRPVRIPAGVTTVPSGASRSSTRSATIARRSSASGIDPSGAEHPGVVERELARRRAGAGRRRGRGRRSARRRRPMRHRSPRSGRPAPGRPSRASHSASRRQRGAGGGHPQGRARRRSRRPTARCAARAAGRAGGAGRRPRWTTARPGRRPRRRDRPARAPRVGTTARSTVAERATDARRGRRPGRRVVADLDDVDAPVEDVGEGHRAPAERSMGVVGRQRELEQEVRQRAARARRAGPPARARPRPAGGRRPRTRPGGRSSRRPGRRPAPAAGSADGRDQRGQLAERAPLVGGRRIAGPDEHAVDARIEQHRRHRQRVGRLRARRDDPPAAPRRRWRRAAPGPAPRRRRPRACGAGGWRPRAGAGRTAPPRRRSSAAASAGSASAARSPRTAMIASTSAPAGIAMEPMSRQRATDPPDQRGGDGGGARIEGEEGARFARHPSMLPGPARDRFGRPPSEWSGAVRRPRRSRRPTPRAGR